MDWDAIRAEFPALSHWTYLNTATFGQIPRRATDAVARHWERRDETACRDFLAWFDDHDRLRESLARLIHATPDDIAFIPGAAYALALPAIWQMAGYVLALFLAGFRGIPDDLREAARVDGASESKIYRYVLIPQLTPTLFTVLIILGHVSMKVFDLIIGINGKSYVTQVVAVYMWEATFDQRNYAKGTAIAMVLLLLIATIMGWWLPLISLELPKAMEDSPRVG